MEGAHRTGHLLLELISNCIVGSHFHLRVVCTVKRSMQLGTRREQRHPWMPGSQPPISVFFFRDDLLRCLPGLVAWIYHYLSVTTIDHLYYVAPCFLRFSQRRASPIMCGSVTSPCGDPLLITTSPSLNNISSGFCSS